MTQYTTLPTPEELLYLQKYFKVDTTLGKVFRNGREVGHLNNHGYMVVSGKATGIGKNRKKHLRSQIIWWAKTGNWPTLVIDHDNAVTTDDRFINLKHGTTRDNNTNTPRKRAGGLPTGVMKSAHANRYEARIVIKGRAKYLGSFMTPEEAGEAYLKAKASL